ncbi:MAG: SH3 domain-containing protein [Alphaproteobacteria bacterium]|nr:SH3 domain-containing protein [Alphaproteobacteria bacterium]
MNIWTALTACCLVLAVATIAAASPTREGVPMPRPKPMLEAALAPAPVAPPMVATGMPVPRWVTVKAERVNVRRGPSLDQDVLWTYVKTGTPVEVIAEYDAWRRIRDVDGVTGWVKGAMLDGRRNVVVTGRVNTAILGEPKADAEAVAFAEPGLVAKLVACAGEWCEISSRGYDGYVARDRLWGVYEHETVK